MPSAHPRGEDEDWLREVAIEMDQEDGLIWVYGPDVNANPRPFVWTKSADDILASIKRFCLATLKTAERLRSCGIPGRCTKTHRSKGSGKRPKRLV